MTRAVSLVPSLTETLFDLGAGEDVVGITDYCIFPAGIERPRVGGTKNPRIEEIRALAPEVVYMNVEENLRRHAEAIGAFARVHLSEPKSVADVASLIAELGRLHGQERRAAELVDMLDAESRAMPRRAFTFAVPIWKEPWMWCGGDTYVSRLVEAAGGTNVVGDRHRYPHLALEEVTAMRPDIVFLPDEPYAFTADDAARIGGAAHGPFPGHLFTWHGTRTIEGLRYLRRALDA